MDASKFRGLQDKLYLAVNAKVTLTTNLQTSNGLTNGAKGTVLDIVYRENQKPNIDLPSFIAVRLPIYDGPQFFAEDSSLKNCIPFGTISIQAQDQIRFTRTQFPFRLSYALTIHKSQGQTINMTVFDIGDKEQAGLTFVALSRVRHIENLAVEDFSFDRLQKLGMSLGFQDRIREEDRLSVLARRTISEWSFNLRHQFCSCEQCNRERQVSQVLNGDPEEAAEETPVSSEEEDDDFFFHDDDEIEEVSTISSYYHERQLGNLCGLHAVNNLLQRPEYSREDFIIIAREFELVLANLNANLTQEYYSADGNFSVEVITRALDMCNIRMLQSTDPTVATLQETPFGYLVNVGSGFDRHWISIRKIGRQWYDFDSLLLQPELLPFFTSSNTSSAKEKMQDTTCFLETFKQVKLTL